MSAVYLGTRLLGVPNPVLAHRCAVAKRDGARLGWAWVRGGVAFYVVLSSA